MRAIMDGEASEAQIAGFLVALRMKGERVEEIVGAARAMRRHATRFRWRAVVDTCGTGGDMRHTFNISTAAALIAPAPGWRWRSTATGDVRVGRRRRRAGSARGPVGLHAENVAACIATTGIGFLFAQAFHPAMRHVADVRSQLGVRTLFNLLGPLTNPAGAERQLLGVFARQWVEPLAQALGRLGSQCALVVHGEDGLDELSLTGPSHVAELRDGTVRTYSFTPDLVGLATCRLEDLAGGDAAANAAIIRGILAGRATAAQRDIAVLNAGAALYVGDVAASIAAGVDAARRAVDSGEAQRRLDALIEFTNR